MTVSRTTSVSSSAVETHHAQRSWLLALVLVAVTFAAYEPTWHAGFIGWDDISYVTDNHALRSLGGLERIWVKPGTTPQYYPLVYTTLWVEYHLWGVQPFGYHLVNILLHGLNAVLVWLILRRLKLPGSWWAAAVYALHPVCVESVAWITELKNTQSGMFFFLSMLCFLRFRPLDGRGTARVGDWRYYPLVLVMFLCALLSKTATCPLPAVLLLLVWWKTGRVERRDVLALAPLFALGIASGFTTSWMEKHYAGVRGSEWELSFVQSCLVAGRGLWFYAGKLFWPHNLTFIYPRWEIDTGLAWQYLFPLAALVVFIALWLLRRRIGRGPLVAVLCFAGTLVPALDFFNQYYFRYSYVADRLQYLACVGLISLAVSTGTMICERAGQRGRRLGALAAAIVLLILGVCTWRQARVYQDFETLWGDTLMKNPQCWVAHLNLANVFSREGKLNDAVGHYEEALRIKPDYVEAHANLAFALFRMGRTSEAIEHYQQALRIQPDYAEAHNGLGFALLQLGRPKEAIEHWEQALRIRPDYAAAHYNLGIALAQLGRVPEAIQHWEEAVRLKPDDAEMHYNLGNALRDQGRVPEAIDQYEQALRIQPDLIPARNALARLQLPH
jgi:tetratricopeptide (TPR) repeat protein